MCLVSMQTNFVKGHSAVQCRPCVFYWFKRVGGHETWRQEGTLWGQDGTCREPCRVQFGWFAGRREHVKSGEQCMSGLVWSAA